MIRACPKTLLFSILLTALAMCLLAGCIVETRTSFIPREASHNVDLFGLYVIDIWGYKERSYDYLTINPSLISPPTDTSMAYSVPRLAIDSVCFQTQYPGQGNSYCLVSPKVDYQKLAPYQVWETNLRIQGNEELFVPAGQFTEPESDLKFSGGAGRVSSFSFKCTNWLRANCSNQEVTALLYARILDRRTGQVIDSTVKMVPYLINVKTRLHSAGDF